MLHKYWNEKASSFVLAIWEMSFGLDQMSQLTPKGSNWKKTKKNQLSLMW